jgi:hypothetical protein
MSEVVQIVLHATDSHTAGCYNTVSFCLVYEIHNRTFVKSVSDVETAGAVCIEQKSD